MTLLQVSNLTKHFKTRGGKVHAVGGVSFEVAKGETLGIVGESGCGKTTLGLLLMKLLEPDAGEIIFEGETVTNFSQRAFRPFRSKLQMVFQDPFASLNPRLRIGEIIEEPLEIHKRGRKNLRYDRVVELLELVGLKAADANKYPHEFSGGQRQRIGIARAIALNPDLIVADEPVSSLDVSIQGNILNLFRDLQKRFHLTYIFISHDLRVISQMSDRIAVMYLGKIVELFPANQLAHVKHPYTQALLKAVPIPDPTRRKEKRAIGGDLPSPIELPAGCTFHPRCPYREEICSHVEPQLEPKGSPDHIASCHFTNKVPQEIAI